MRDTNIEENPRINVRVNYGQRESALVKVIEGNYPLLISSDYVTPILVLVLIIVVVIFQMYKTKKLGNFLKKSK